MELGARLSTTEAETVTWEGKRWRMQVRELSQGQAEAESFPLLPLPRPSSPHPGHWSPWSPHCSWNFQGPPAGASICWQNLSLEDSQGLGMRALSVRVLEFTLPELGGCRRAQSRGVTQFDSCFTTLTSVSLGLLCEEQNIEGQSRTSATAPQNDSGIKGPELTADGGQAGRCRAGSEAPGFRTVDGSR